MLNLSQRAQISQKKCHTEITENTENTEHAERFHPVRDIKTTNLTNLHESTILVYSC